MNKCIAVLQAESRAKNMRENMHSLGIYFDEKAANKIVEFSEKYCCHWKGKLAGKPFILAPFQKFILREIYGWKKTEDDTRLYREVFMLLARKNSKTFICSIMALYALVCDNEQGGEVYSIATKRDQSKRVFDDVINVIRNSMPSLRKQLTVTKHEIRHNKSNSIMTYLSCDSKTLDGLNVSFGVIDEIQSHPNSGVYDIITTSTGLRVQPLIVVIGTAGQEEISIAKDLYNHAKSVLDPKDPITDPTLFVYITELDEDDDWMDPMVWEKANPLLGIGMSREDFTDVFNKKKDIPSQRAVFQRLHCNIWIRSTDSIWLNQEHWDRSCVDFSIDDYMNREWIAGLDLSTTKDLTCLSLLSIPEHQNEKIVIYPFFFMPKANIYKKVHEDRVPYDQWVEKGLIITTEGESVNYGAILTHLIKLREKGFSIKELHFDRWNATQIIKEITDNGFNCVEFIQGKRSYHPVCQLFEEFLAENKFISNHEVLTWNARNTRVKCDDKGKMEPTKKYGSDIHRIDGIIASLMALDYFVRNFINLENKSFDPKTILGLPSDIRNIIGF